MPKKADDAAGAIQVHLRLRPTKKNSGYFSQDSVDESIVRLNIPERGEPRHELREQQQDAVQLQVQRRAGHARNRGRSSTAWAATPSRRCSTASTDHLRVRPDGQRQGLYHYGRRGQLRPARPDPWAISMIFQEFNGRSDYQQLPHQLPEIYNESGFDLLDPSHETKSLEDLPKVT